MTWTALGITVTALYQLGLHLFSRRVIDHVQPRPVFQRPEVLREIDACSRELDRRSFLGMRN